MLRGAFLWMNVLLASIFWLRQDFILLVLMCWTVYGCWGCRFCCCCYLVATLSPPIYTFIYQSFWPLCGSIFIYDFVYAHTKKLRVARTFNSISDAYCIRDSQSLIRFGSHSLNEFLWLIHASPYIYIHNTTNVYQSSLCISQAW